MAETIYDGPSGDFGDSLLVEVAAQRDQLDQQVRELLDAVSAHRGRIEAVRVKGVAAVVSPTDAELYAAADKVRKERGE